MKIAILNDSHFGYKNGAQLVFDYQWSFFEKQFFPYCVKHDIKHIIHLGDVFDTRRHVTVKTLNYIRTKFVATMEAAGITMHVIPGNHDVAYKNTNDLSAVSEYLFCFPNSIHVHMSPVVLNFDGLDVALVPWITDSNRDECINFINTSPAHILMGHFEISGFKYIANSSIKSHGLAADAFSRYDMVLSGHYHTKSSRGNITYCGSQYQFNWSDVDDKKYFHVLNTETRALHAVQNKHKLFYKFYYDDALQIDLDNPEFKRIKGCYVRVIVVKKRDYLAFDKYIDRLKEFMPFDLQVVESFEDVTLISGESDSAVIEDTTILLDDYIDEINTALDREALKRHMHNLYTEAIVYDTI